MKHMIERYRLLLNTLLENPESWEIHSFFINDKHQIEYSGKGDGTITVYADGMYLASKFDKELLTEYADEALEYISMGEPSEW